MMEGCWRKGQRVHAWAYGAGVIDQVKSMDNYPIKVKFSNSCYASFTKDGKEHDYHAFPTLIPLDTERPRKKEKKMVEAWVNIYRYSDGRIFAGKAWSSKGEADKNADDDRLGPAYHIVHEWEEEER